MAITLDGTAGIDTPALNPSGGNVGIGTNTPQAKLSVSNAGAAGLEFFVNYPGGGVGTYIQSYNRSTSAFTDTAYDASAHSFHTSGTERMSLTSTGHLCVGTTNSAGMGNFKSAPSTIGIVSTGLPNGVWNTAQLVLETDGGSGSVWLAFHVAGAAAPQLRCERGAGEQIDCVNGVTSAFAPLRASAFTVNSDYRVKENVVPIENAISRLVALKPCRFNFTESSMSYQEGRTVDGFLAHEAQEVVPEAVTGEKDEMMSHDPSLPKLQSIDQSKIVPLLTAALQELSAKVDALQSEVNTLKAV